MPKKDERKWDVMESLPSVQLYNSYLLLQVDFPSLRKKKVLSRRSISETLLYSLSLQT